MADPPSNSISISGVREARKAGATIRLIACIRDSEGRLTPYLRFTGTTVWRALVDRRRRTARHWTNFERLRRALLRLFSYDGCLLVCPAGGAFASRWNLHPA